MSDGWLSWVPHKEKDNKRHLAFKTTKGPLINSTAPSPRSYKAAKLHHSFSLSPSTNAHTQKYSIYSSKIPTTMPRLLVAMKQKLLRATKKRVADESSIGNGPELPVGGQQLSHRHTAWSAISSLYHILRAPMVLMGCIDPNQINGADDMWVSGEFSTTSEMNYLMVRDSMRYAIYV